MTKIVFKIYVIFAKLMRLSQVKLVLVILNTIFKIEFVNYSIWYPYYIYAVLNAFGQDKLVVI